MQVPNNNNYALHTTEREAQVNLSCRCQRVVTGPTVVRNKLRVCQTQNPIPLGRSHVIYDCLIQ